ncbi:hypothetical protein [Actinophytocola sp.]|uniref:DUF7144 family membrane protein n=1 Tax=Actinophytocola sp. TaxID=1872138 RepID=UPI003899C9D5
MGEHAVQERPRQTFWSGWIRFGGAMMIMVGSFSLIEGLIALFQNEYYLTTAQGVLLLDLTGWGWLHLSMGVVAILIGLGLFRGATWARIAGVVFACLNVVAQLAFMAAYPLWATVVITVDILVIWALIVHGGETDQDW